MAKKSFLYQHILPPIGWMAIQGLTSTLNIQTKGLETVKELENSGVPVVFAIWHGRQMLPVKLLSKRNVCAMSSTSRDGMLQTQILKKFGFEIVHGSSHRSPVRALVGALKKMQEGYNIAMAVDGPRGPIYTVKPGAIYLAKKMNAFLVPFTFSSKPSLFLKAWDRYLVPMPFSNTMAIYGRPYRLSSDLSETQIARDCLDLQKKLFSLKEKADQWVGLSNEPS